MSSFHDQQVPFNAFRDALRERRASQVHEILTLHSDFVNDNRFGVGTHCIGFGWLPLHWICRYVQDCDELFRILLDHGLQIE